MSMRSEGWETIHDSVYSQSKMILPAAFAALYWDAPAPIKTSTS